MRITKEVQNCLHVIAQLSGAGDGVILSRREIATETGISANFLSTSIRLLERTGFVVVHRGPAGGVRLAMDPGEITAAAIIKACNGGPIKLSDGDTRVDKMLDGLSGAIDDYLDRFCGEDLVD